MTGFVVLLAIVLAVGAFGLYRRHTQGRLRPATKPGPSVAALVPVELGEQATIVQFSSTTCAACGPARRLLVDVATQTPGVNYVDLNAEDHLDLVRDLGILRTPTILILDRDGQLRLRAAGPPRRDDVLAALSAA